MKTHVTFVLDSSGSMEQIKDDTIGGFNAFLDDQRDETGEATVTLYNFDTTIEQVYEGRPIADAPDLDEDTYRPGGRTALHDAIVTAIDDTISLIDSQPPDERPDHVVVPILTDGKENASETPQEVVRDRIETCQTERDWEFLFIGANQDAALTASEMGMDKDKSLSMAATDEGTEAVYDSVSDSVSRARQTGSTSGFTDADRERQDAARKDGEQ
jgi:hypothetical protein